ncbi:hypothetical protein BRC80_00540 [Halobacteriales archaeon QH_9_66_26]|nr:MAG: hypothetical protein BRC80_00540 [Halobacteriales archaeon QH_9_66_26]
MSASTSESTRVLHVDDDPAILDLAATFLEREAGNFAVETATSATEALDRLTRGEFESDVPFDCIVSDYEMPEMDGLEFLEAVREDHPDLPFVLFTGKGGEEIASEAITAGVSDYLNKGSGTDQYALLANRIGNLASRYRTERELQQSTERMRKLYGGITDAIFVLNEDWEFTHLNDRAEELLQRSEAELIGEDVWEQFPERVDTVFQENYEKAMNQGETVEFETFSRVRDVWVRVRAIPIEDGLAVHFRDISEKKERERTIQRQNQRLRTIVDNAPIILFAFDEDGIVTLSEGQGLEGLGAEPGELVGESMYDIYAGTSIPEHVRRVINGEEVNTTVTIGNSVYEAWCRPLENDEDIDSRAIGVAIDVTERAGRERELREERAFVNSVLDAIPDVLYAFDEERTMLRWNDQLSTLTGYSDAEIAEMAPLDFVADGDVQTLKQTTARVFSEGVVATDQVKLVTKAGKHIPTELTAAPIIDEDGIIVGVTGTGREITELKEREREQTRKSGAE